jgi:hypothetical protein
MNAAVEQLEMLGRRGERVPDDYQRATALKCRSSHHALLKCVEISDLTAKQIYSPLGIEQSQWSRIIAGTAFLNPDLRSPLMELCGNDVPLLYEGIQRGYELTRVKTNLEARVAQLEAELMDERRVTKRLGEMLRGL